MSYWDTSTLVKLYTKEADSAVFESHAHDPAVALVTSKVALYEARATFHRKEAEGLLQKGTAENLYLQLLQDVANGEVQIIEINAQVEQEYGQVLSQCVQANPPILLRTLDALHLASARAGGLSEIVATDRRMRDGAKVLGFSVYPP